MAGVTIVDHIGGDPGRSTSPYLDRSGVTSVYHIAGDGPRDLPTSEAVELTPLPIRNAVDLTPDLIRSAPEPQPGDRPPAPGELALVQSFVNSFWDLPRGRPEQFKTAPALGRWLRQRGLLARGVNLTDADLQRALDAREGLRALLLENNGLDADPVLIDRLNRALRLGRVYVALHPGERPRFAAPRRDLDGALGLIASIVAVAELDGRFARLKACPGPDCGWAFYDHSRNQTSTWCSMSVCGAREKARHYRARRRRMTPAGRTFRP